MDKEQKVVEPSVWDKWKGARAAKRAQNPRDEIVERGDAVISSLFTGTALLVVGVLWDVTVATLKWAFCHVIGILIFTAIIAGIITFSTSTTSDLRKINLMWEEHPGMRPHITEAAKDGTITRWEARGLTITLRNLVAANAVDHEQEQLQHKIDAEQQK